jgi:2'-5' RNA ligase
MRLFFSIALTQSLCEQIIKSREEIKRKCFTQEQLQRMRGINEKEYHITQFFIGEVNEERLGEVENVAQNIFSSTKSFTLETDKFEFKPVHNPRLLWLRFHPNETFTTLMQQLQNDTFDKLSTGSAEPGLTNNEVDKNPIPHVTLIRLKQVKPIVGELPEFAKHEIHVQQIDLMQSFTKPTGSEYKLSKRFELKSE